jgi:hypothetical protein
MSRDQHTRNSVGTFELAIDTLVVVRAARQRLRS